MKKYIVCFFCLFAVVATLAACKKDALEVTKDSYYIQVNAGPQTDPLISTATTLMLRPGGIADIMPGGDIVWRGTYKISGKRLTVTVKELETKFRFTIISATELHGEGGSVLRLQ